MELSYSLRIQPGMAVAFCGAGGKTTAITRAATELRSVCPVVFTTTTKIGLDQASLGSHLIITDPTRAPALGDVVEAGGVWVITGEQVPGEAKWQGLEPEILEALWDRFRPNGAIMLIEADGARQASLKVPASYEPVIPTWVDMAVLLAGLDVIGSSIQGPLVHRPDDLARFLGRAPGAPIEWPDVVRVLGDPAGGLKGVPERSEARVLLTKATDQSRVMYGEQISEQLMEVERILSISIGDLLQDEPVIRSYSRTAGVILAAGGASRFGDQKLLFTWQDKPLVQWAVEAARSGGLDPIVLVVGMEGETIRSMVGDPTITCIENERWQEGQSTSLRLGLQVVEPAVEAVVFLLGDMPLVDGELIQALVDAHRSTMAPIIAPQLGERLGNPVLFDQATFEALHDVRGDRGGRAIFDQFPIHMVEWGKAARVDIDTAEDLQILNS